MRGIMTDFASVSLEECPVGLFETMTGALCLKSEYQLDSYIVSTGERFWGGTTSLEELAKVRVIPCRVIS